MSALSGKRVAVVGAGALGAPLAERLARAGCTSIRAIDRDIAETGRQRGSAAGKAKATALAEATRGAGVVTPLVLDVNSRTVAEALAGAQIVFDCTDNAFTKQLVNEFCAQERLPLVTCSAEGALGLVVGTTGEPPCLACALGTEERSPADRCAGIEPSTAQEVADAACRTGARLLSSGASASLVYLPPPRRASFRPRADCPVCGGRYELLGKPPADFTRICDGTVQLLPKRGERDVSEGERSKPPASRERGVRVVQTNDARVALFPDGRALIFSDEELDEPRARALYSRALGELAKAERQAR